MKFIVTNNTLIPQSKEAQQFIQDNQGREVEVKITRSNEHFNLFWLWIETIREYSGYTTKEEAKYWLFLTLGFTKTYTNKKTGQEILRDESVADGISKKRLNEIMLAIKQLADEHNITLPDPTNLMSKLSET